MKLKHFTKSIFIISFLLTGCGGEKAASGKRADEESQVSTKKTQQEKISHVSEKKGQGHAFKKIEKTYFRTKKEKKQLFKELNVEYLDYTVIDYLPLLKADVKKCSSYRNQESMNELLSQLYADDIASKKIAPLSVRWLGQEIGYGIFAEADLACDDFIGIYTGVVQDRDLVGSKDYTWAYPVRKEDGGKISLDAKFKGNELRFVNHSYNPNSVVRYVLGLDGLWHVCYIASKEIKKGQQVLISYGTAYWESRKYSYKEINP